MNLPRSSPDVPYWDQHYSEYAFREWLNDLETNWLQEIMAAQVRSLFTAQHIYSGYYIE